MHLPYPTDQAGVVSRLAQERLIVQDSGGSISLSRLGALLLAKQLSDFPDIARKAPRVVVYAGRSKLETRLEQTGAKGYAVGFQGLIKFIMSQLPQNEVIEDALRREVKLLPEIVIREVVANALIHQDVEMTGTSVMIEIYTDRFEISNPGEPVVPAERFIDNSRSRNERLAHFMRRFGICEEKGSGIDKVIHFVEMFQLPAPDFRSNLNRTMVTISGPKNFDDMGRDERTRACYQHACLKYVTGEHMTNQSLRNRFSLPESKSPIVSQVIATAVAEGQIKADESVGASRKYKRYLPFWA